MTKVSKTFSLTILAFLCFVDVSYSATATGTANARVVTPIAVAATTPLQFGSFASSGVAGTINQVGAVTGGVVAVNGGVARTAGVFTVSGEASASYTFTLPANVTLSNGSNNMTATLSYSSGTGARTLTAGSDTITVNGVLTVATNQVAGAYTGTYSVTAVY